MSMTKFFCIFCQFFSKNEEKPCHGNLRMSCPYGIWIRKWGRWIGPLRQTVWFSQISLFGTLNILRYPIVLQGMFFWQKNKYFQKMPTLFWISKKPNWVPAEWYWRLRFENTMRHFVIISWCFDKNFHCVLKSQPSAPFSRTQFGFFEIQNKEGIFWKYLFFLPEKHSLKLCGITQNKKSPK